MKHIYYRNDFSVEVELFNFEGVKVSPPEWKWSIEFSDSRKKYVCSLEKGNAEVMDDGSVMCYLDNHNFYCGRLSCKFKEQIPNLSYLDGFQRVIRPTDIDVELWDKPSDNDGNVSVSVIPDYVIYDAWNIAKANGYSGTQEEFYTALNELPKTIETAESVLKDTKNLADDLAEKVATDYYRGEKGDKGDKGDVGEKGEQGEQGIQGIQGDRGTDGFSPIVSLTKEGSISTLSITDAQGEHTTEIADGAKGEKGDKGERGLQGVQGVKGDDGVSPTVKTSKTGNVTTIEITDANGVHTATVNDGDSVEVVQSTGTSTTAVMSQKAVSDFEDTIRDQVNNYKPIVIEGNVTNAADEEDITSENGLLKIKNRSALNGMGYVILRQNKDFAEQVIKANTIYEIRYDFDLNGAEITIPENCVLKFNGGKLLNGSWKYSSKGNYIIKATQVGFIEGTSEKIANFNGTLLQNLMTANIGVDFENKEYNFNILRSVPCNFIYIKGGTLNLNMSSGSIFTGVSNSTDKPIIHIENTTINNIGNRKDVYLIFATNLDFYYDYCLIKKCIFNNFLSIRLHFGDFDSNIHKVGVNTTIIEDCIFKDLEGTFYMCNDAYYNSVVIRGNVIKNNKYSVFYFATTNEYESSANAYRNGKFIFENNYHVNDSDFLSTPNLNTYICTVLVEGNEVYFNNNTFENIRAFNSVVYAFYVSSIYFKCTNNIIKNVFNFNQCTYPIVKLSFSNCHNEIFKSKGGAVSSLTNPNIRIFDNNIVTINRENYISAMKLSSEFPNDYAHYDDVMLFTKLFSPTQPQNIEFTNNNIDIEGVISLATSTEDILNIKYNYNKLKFYNAAIFNGSDPLTVLNNTSPGYLVRSYLDKYTTTFEIIGNTFECTNNEKYATFYFTSFTADVNNQNYNNPMKVVISNNIGNNVWLQLSQSGFAYTGDITPKKDILIEGNTSNVADVCTAYPVNNCEIPSVGNIKIKGSFTWYGRLYSKLLDLEFNVSNIASADNTYGYVSRELEVPKLDTENECYVFSYTKKDGSKTDIELYKKGNSYLANSNTYLDTTIFYKDISQKISIAVDNSAINSAFILTLDEKFIQIQGLLGTNNQLNNYKLKYYPYRKNLKLDRGQSKYRPRLDANDEGFEYYDSTLKKKIIWNGTNWTNMDGTAL